MDLIIDQEIIRVSYEDERRIKTFLRENNPDALGVKVDIRYFNKIHVIIDLDSEAAAEFASAFDEWVNS